MALLTRKHLACALSLVLSCSIIISTVFRVYATDSVDKLEQTTEDLEGELSDLNKDLKTLKKELSSLTKQIEKTADHISEVREELAIAKGEEEAQYEAMKLRMVYIYESGNTDFLELLLTSNGLADFLNRAEYVAMVNDYDRKALEKMQETREAIAEQEAQLASEQKNLAQMQKDLESKENALNSQISDTSGELADYQKKLAKAKDDAKKAEEESKKPVIPVTPPSYSTPDRGDVDFNSNYTVSEQELLEFAALLQCEAGTSHEEGILAVASVVVNRMKSSRYPDTLHGVMFQSGQFPPAGGARFNRILANGVNPTCLRIAKEALAGKNNVGDCLSFRAASSGRPGTVIGSNVFF